MLGLGPALDRTPHVEHRASVGRAPDGVEVGFDNLWDLAPEKREAQDQLAQCLTIKPSGAAAEESIEVIWD